ncbi:endolytic transglycosylase MltG [Hellea sp.]|nr:endolytic transglycosylase MltG [Hellea sp.]
MPKKNKLLLIIIALIAFFTIICAVLTGIYAYINYEYEINPKGTESEVSFKVDMGSSLSEISQNLEKEDIIRSSKLFTLVTKLRGNEAKFKAGEFLLTKSSSMATIFNQLSKGKEVLYPFTIAEGLTSKQIVKVIGKNKLFDVSSMTIPEEGTLLPETFMVPKGMKASLLLEKMQIAQIELIDSLWSTRQKNLPFKSIDEAIILASIVEKETAHNSERDIIAGVFINRLRMNMRLQTDPTIIYGISGGEPLYNSKGERRTLYRSEINKKTPWNTYQIDGLPMTPICNPGEASIRAVLNPAKTNFLFFVADGTGGHAFAKTNKEHIINVNKWRKIERTIQRSQRKKRMNRLKSNTEMIKIIYRVDQRAVQSESQIISYLILVDTKW